MSVYVILLGMVIGILCGLYCKIGMAFILLLYIIFMLIFNFSRKLKRYQKVLSIKKWLKMLIICSVSFFMVILQREYMYEKITREMLENEKYELIIISDKIEKEYYYQYKAKIKKIGDEQANCTVLLNVKKQIDLKYEEHIIIKGKYIEPKKSRNDKGFSYQSYLKSIRYTRNN